MNLAFPALVLFLLLLPGVLFRYAYLRGFLRRSPISSQSLVEDLAWTVWWASVFQVGGIWASSQLGLKLDFARLIPPITGQYGPDQEFLARLLSDLQGTGLVLLVYPVVVSFLAYLLGLLLHAAERRFGLDRWRPLRFPNDWFYLLDEKENRARHFAGLELSAFGVYFSAVVDQKDASYLYRGLVRDWQLDRQGNLDRVELVNAYRRKFADDRAPNQEHDGRMEADPRYYRIVGAALVLRASEMRTMNVQYGAAVDAATYEVADVDRVSEDTPVEELEALENSNEPTGSST